MADTDGNDLAPAVVLDNFVRLDDPPGRYSRCGAFSEIYFGRCQMPSGAIERVVLKVFRGAHINQELLEKATRRINRESRVWVRLRHPNILPFYGVCVSLLPSSALVSPYCEAGTVLQYLSTAGNVNKIRIVFGIATGLQYLHANKVIHGDLRPNNVLMGPDGQPKICDFGCSKIIGIKGFTTNLPNAYRFMAPELLRMEGLASLSHPADVYAFAMVTLEILTGRLPFYHVIDAQVPVALYMGQRPERTRYTAPELGNWLWSLLQDCWRENPNERPTMAVVCQTLAEHRN